MKSLFDNLGGTYHSEGDYLIPDIVTLEAPHIGVWGRRRKYFLQQHHESIHNAMLLSGRLNAHLEEIDRSANEMFDLLMKQYAEREGVTEQLRLIKNHYLCIFAICTAGQGNFLPLTSGEVITSCGKAAHDLVKAARLVLYEFPSTCAFCKLRQFLCICSAVRIRNRYVFSDCCLVTSKILKDSRHCFTSSRLMIMNKNKNIGTRGRITYFCSALP